MDPFFHQKILKYNDYLFKNSNFGQLGMNKNKQNLINPLIVKQEPIGCTSPYSFIAKNSTSDKKEGKTNIYKKFCKLVKQS